MTSLVQTDPLKARLLRAPRPIDVVQVQTAATDVITARPDADYQIETLFAINTTATADWVTLHLVPDGGTAGAANMIAYQLAVPSKGRVAVFTRETPCALEPGYTLQALCSANDAVNVFGHGYDYEGQYG